MSSHRLCGFALALGGVAGPAAFGEPLTSCEQSVLPTCDAREADCQRALHEHVACARGVAAGEDLPTFSFLAPAEFAARCDASTSLSAEMVQAQRDDARLDDYDEAVRDLYAYARSDSYTLPQVDRHFPAIGARFALKTCLAQQPGALAEAYAWAYYSLLACLDPPPPPQPYEEVNDVEPPRFAAVSGRWAGDRFDCYADAINGTPLVVWDLAVDPTVELGPFAISESTLATWRWVEREDSLTLVVGLDEAAVQSIVDGL